MAYILSLNTAVIVIFLILITFKAMKIGGEQTKNRYNDFFQMLTCVIIPGLAAVVFLKTLRQVWYYRPYENIFESIAPQHLCLGILVLAGTLVVNQMLGARAGNVESSLSVNVYCVLQLIFAMVIASQWAFLFKEYQAYRMGLLQDQNEIANLMTYIHQNDFKFILGGIGSLGTTVGSD